MAKSAASGTAASRHAYGEEKRRGFFGRIFQFLREVIAELKKVTTPTRRELFSYVVIVIIFVLFMMLLIFGLDYLFGQGAFWIFGNGTLQ
ncbi:preprotein translocase subunit SecE [uncultured Rothia sp.]|mgnify:CR=1 FL=1|uniref:preprotein translocase subunit SecE n=1 Tax=uncultured Rothia sp. TaxID=316088 RepID=UPI0032180265